MEVLRRLLALLSFLALPVAGEELPYRVIAYHDVRDEVAADYDPDQFAVSTANLIDHFSWLRDNGYQAVSIDQIIAARNGEKPLPQKSVLLTFDDGLASFYTHVFPLLKMFSYPAVIGVVTSWIDSEASIDYAGRERGKAGFLEWEQMREMQASGLVEFASHTHDMHKGIRANPQGNLQPASKARAYADSEYESEAEFRRRIAADLDLSITKMRRELGRQPRVIVWPYGAYNSISAEVAGEYGMPISLTLQADSGSDHERLYIGRYLITANPTLGEFSAEFLLPKRPPVIRAAQIDIDDIYDPDPTRQRRNLDLLLDRIKSMQISHVFLSPLADKDSDGSADAAYFPNRHLPVQADIFGFVSWQLKTRAGVSVLAQLPMLAYEGRSFDPDWYVVDVDTLGQSEIPGGDPRPLLSPFNAPVRKHVAEVFEDLAAWSHLDGILFHETALPEDPERLSESVVATLKEEFGQDFSPTSARSSEEQRHHLQKLLALEVTELSETLMAHVRRYHPSAKSARSLPATALLGDEKAGYSAEDFDSLLRSYDFVVLTTPHRETGTNDGRDFLASVVSELNARKEGLARSILGLRTIDQTSSKRITHQDLRSTMRLLQSMGVRNLGYYPDDIVDANSDISEIRLGMSLAEDLSGEYR